MKLSLVLLRNAYEQKGSRNMRVSIVILAFVCSGCFGTITKMTMQQIIDHWNKHSPCNNVKTVDPTDNGVLVSGCEREWLCHQPINCATHGFFTNCTPGQATCIETPRSFYARIKKSVMTFLGIKTGCPETAIKILKENINPAGGSFFLMNTCKDSYLCTADTVGSVNCEKPDKSLYPVDPPK